METDIEAMKAPRDPLRKIPVAQARQGMYVHALEGSWFDHSYWRRSFLLSSVQEVQQLQASGAREVWIDIDQGEDLESAPAQVRAPEAAKPAERTPDVGSPPPHTARVELSDELHAAAAVCARGTQAVKSMFQEIRLGRAIDPERCLPIVAEVTDSVMRNPGALVSLARLKTKDDYTYMHSVAVCALMVAVARQMGQDEAQCRQAGFAGLLHDLGKAVMPSAVLNKPGKLSDAEFDIIRSHPERGHALLLESRGADEVALDVCLHHHEKWVGGGYPHNLHGEAISLHARMGAVCDVYDAITSNRPYKSGWDPAESIARMASWKGHFEPKVFNHFVQSLGIYPTGTLVRLQSQRLAVVVEQDARSLVAPVVKVCFSLKSQMPLTPQLLRLADGGGDKIVGRESNADWKFPWIDALWAGDIASSRS
jgi:putative nucleotidyltransferase with HDIG domain